MVTFITVFVILAMIMLGMFVINALDRRRPDGAPAHRRRLPRSRTTRRADGPGRWNM
ncbi:hypothetical protein [Streptomyces sp. NPDC002889]|uniref:hypothetical protein n=1 Tax=Streptomyces sp. NPDC002889 TaxID=3364669 RepID=UPI0036B5E72E